MDRKCFRKDRAYARESFSFPYKSLLKTLFRQEMLTCLLADRLRLVHDGGEHEHVRGDFLDRRVGAGLEGIPVLVAVVLDGIDKVHPVAEAAADTVVQGGGVLAAQGADLFLHALLDLIGLGLAEAETFPDIPVKVTINEYVEISKYFSTPKSRSFVNGLLDRLIKESAAEGRINKAGKGLL